MVCSLINDILQSGGFYPTYDHHIMANLSFTKQKSINSRNFDQIKLIAKMVVMAFFGDFAWVDDFCNKHKLWLDHQVFAT